MPHRKGILGLCVRCHQQGKIIRVVKSFGIRNAYCVSCSRDHHVSDEPLEMKGCYRCSFQASFKLSLEDRVVTDIFLCGPECCRETMKEIKAPISAMRCQSCRRILTARFPCSLCQAAYYCDEKCREKDRKHQAFCSSIRQGQHAKNIQVAFNDEDLKYKAEKMVPSTYRNIVMGDSESMWIVFGCQDDIEEAIEEIQHLFMHDFDFVLLSQESSSRSTPS
jgi:hypothetical protein